MGKPWAKIEIGYLDHPKFQALNANAIALWHEGKQYCDRFNTDGFIPTDVAKRFRFGGKKSILMLTTAINFPKPEGGRYAALWEIHLVGYKMHDYLDHNDCRDEVLTRLEDAADVAELRQLGNKERQRKCRADRKMKIAASVTLPVTDVTRDVTRDRGRPTEAATETTTETDPQKPLEQVSEGGAPAAPRPRPLAPIHDASHRKHAVCGRVCLHASLFNDFVRRRNHDDADQEIREWAAGVVDEWTTGLFQTVEPGDSFDFWKARYAEKWPAAAPVSSSKVPAWLRKPV